MRDFIIGYNSEQIEQCLENLLNLVFNRSIGCTPHELHFKKNGLGESIEVSPQIYARANEITQSQILYDKNIRKNKKEVCDIKIGDLIFVKASRGSKQSILWKGPYQVLETNLKSNGLKIQIEKNRNHGSMHKIVLFGGAECRNQIFIKIDYDNQCLKCHCFE
ncbi:hypothetical protein M153_5000024969 [Pseudoloma neurophilia]|uniref:Transposable element n=1 Tax=Pseudoloma neurophilia TaxID=146866 RepID=A0A0R0M9S4_9MICR|nr:hypothetical protein M153_5000024969 [Pseudoloma neurophilia]